MKTYEENKNTGQNDIGNAAGKALMSVAEMREMLGLKRTDSYWLVHKGFFETKQVMGKMWVDKESFEKWYANQVKYHKVTGKEPGSELKARSYSVRDAAQMLGLHEATFYAVIKRDHIETFLVDHWMRISKEEFERWYAGQDQYTIRNSEEELAPEKTEVLEAAVDDTGAFERKDGKDSKIVITCPEKDRPERLYISVEEAAQAAGVTRATISCWIFLMKLLKRTVPA